MTALLVEDFWASNRELDWLLNRKGFVKLHQLPIDSLYVPRHVAARLPAALWYPAAAGASWSEWQSFRATHRSGLAPDLR